jgi:PAS domain S-box-containing protein
MANILIVDDDPSFVHLLTNLIASFGETPYSAMQGAHFFQIMEEESIDLILLDIYMPVISGITLIKQLKKNKKYKHIPVIMITGSNNLSKMTECFEAGASDFITKPISPILLQARLTSILEKQKDIERLKQEIAERKKAETSLRKLTIAMEQSPNILFLTDARYRIEYANPKCLEVTGYLLEEIIGRSTQIFHASSSKTPSYDHILKNIAKTGIWKGNLCNQKKNGELFWVSCTISPVLDDEGIVANYLSIQEDITERKKAKEILAQKTRSLEISENRLRMIIEATNDGIIIIGQDQVIHFVNPAAEKLLGNTASKLVGEIFQYPLIPNQMTEINIKRSGQTDMIADMRVVKTETDDGSVWVASIREITHENANIPETVSIPPVSNQQSFNDNESHYNKQITEPDSLENDVLNSNSDCVSNISHEFRTPMHAILSFANFGIKKIQQSPRNKLLHYFEQIKVSANRLMPLINDLLELYNLESGKYSFNKRPQDIVPIILFVIQEKQTIAKEKQIKISLIPPKCDTIVPFNKNAMIQVIRKILQNAIHFSGNNTDVKIHIDCFHENEKKYLVINFIDEGIGIPENELGNIFSKFYQCEKTKSHFGGTGIGLSICKHIVLKHGGEIGAKNNGIKGACIYFTLPI